MNLTRKDLNIKAHMNYALFVVAVNPIRFVYMTVDDDVFNPGDIVPHLGGQFFHKLETAEAVRDRMQRIGLVRQGQFGKFIVAKPEDIKVMIVTIDEYLEKYAK